jgi:hypothetical protein
VSQEYSSVEAEGDVRGGIKGEYDPGQEQNSGPSTHGEFAIIKQEKERLNLYCKKCKRK